MTAEALTQQVMTSAISTLVGVIVGLVVAQVRVVEPFRKRLEEIAIGTAEVKSLVSHLEADVKMLRAQLWDLSRKEQGA